MFSRILVGYDGSDQARDAAGLGRLLAEVSGAKLTLAAVLPQDPLTGGRDVLFKDSDAELRCKLEEAAEPIGATTLTLPSSSPARGLHELAEGIGAQLLVVGSSHRAGIGRAVAGTVAQRLLHGAPCAVAVAPDGYRLSEPGLHVLAVGYDGEPESRQALAAAIDLALAGGGTLRLYVGLDPQPFGAAPFAGAPGEAYRDALREHYESKLQEALASIPAELHPSAEPLRGEVAGALVAEADKGADLLCIGSRGYGPVRRVLLGSVSSELIKSAPCPLLILPRGTGEEPASDRDAPLARAGSGHRID